MDMVGNRRTGRKRIDFSDNARAEKIFQLCYTGVISKREAARLLNVSPMTICRRLREYEIIYG